jgi:hypothetical protein
MSAALFHLGRAAVGVPRAVAFKEQEVVVSHVDVLEEHEVPKSMFDQYKKADDMLAALEASLCDLTDAMSDKPNDSGFWIPNVSIKVSSQLYALHVSSCLVLSKTGKGQGTCMLCVQCMHRRVSACVWCPGALMFFI